MDTTVEVLKKRIQDAFNQGTELNLSLEEVETLALLVFPNGFGMTTGEILDSGFIGVWAHRDDIEDGAIYAEQLRREIEERKK